MNKSAGFIFSLLLVCCLPAWPSGATVVRFHRVVAFLPANIRHGHSCVTYQPYISSGKFFENLTLTETASGKLYRNDGATVATFPEELTLEIDVTARPCTIGELAEGTDFGENLRLAVEWLGQAAKPSDVIEEKVTSEPWTELTKRWHYRLHLHCNDVPIQDKLKITILQHSGVLIAQIIGGHGSN